MKKRFFALPALFALCSLLASCTTPPKVEVSPTPSVSPAPALDAGRWELVCEDYRRVGYDLCDAIYFPKYEGKTEEQWADYSISIGRSDQSFMTWARGGVLSPDGRYLAYSSDKDCLEPDTLNNMSVVLLDMYSQTEQVLLSGADYGYSSPVRWLDNETLLCTSTQWDEEGAPTEQILCGVDGSSKPLVLEDSTDPTPFATNGRILAYITGEERNSLRVVLVEADGGVTELGKKEFERRPENGGGLSADGTRLVFPIRLSPENANYKLCVWNLETGETVTLENPIPVVGEEIGASWARWDGEYPEVDFRIENAPDSNGHNELWRYVFET